MNSINDLNISTPQGGANENARGDVVALPASPLRALLANLPKYTPPVVVPEGPEPVQEAPQECLTRLEGAHLMTSLGGRVIPLRGKVPASGGWQDAGLGENDPLLGGYFSGEGPKDFNPGVITGRASGFFVLDVDVKNGQPGMESLAALGDLGETFTVRTASGGLHLYFQMPEGQDIRNSAGSIAPGLDIRGSGGYVVAPGAKTPQGAYTVEKLADIAPAPAALLEAVNNSGGGAGEKPSLPVLAADTQFPKGTRNEMLFRFACRDRARGATDSEVEDLARGRNARHCVPPLDDSELLGVVFSACNYARGLPVTPTQLEAVDMFADLHREDFAYTEGAGWLAFRGSHWVEEAPREAIAGMLTGCLARADGADQVKAARAMQKVSWVDAIEKQSRVKFLQADSAFDAEGYLLNTPSGLVDLRTGRMRATLAADLCRKITKVGFDASGDCPQFKKFLEWFCAGDQKLLDYLQQVLGTMLVWDPWKRIFPVLVGNGRNGKSVLAEVLRQILGSYAVRAPKEIFLKRKAEGQTNDFARLAGARLIAASEGNLGDRLDEGAVKMLTGGEEVAARPQYRGFFNVNIGATPLLTTNSLPFWDGRDDAIRDRVHIIPGLNKVPDGEKDPGLADRLVIEEGPAILGWLAEGARKWFEGGRYLTRPAVVLEANEKHLDEISPIRVFLREMVSEVPGSFTTRAGLKLYYEGWCRQEGVTPLTDKGLFAVMRAEGFPDHKRGGQRGFLGVKLGGGP